MLMTYLHGLALSNYRGIGSETQYIGPFGKCNFFIGTNNSGKSNVLNFLSRHLNSFINSRQTGTALKLDALEVHLGATRPQVVVGIAVPKSSVLGNAVAKLEARGYGKASQPFRLLQQVVAALSSDSLVWVEAPATNLETLKFSKDITKRSEWPIADWHQLWHALTGQSGGDSRDWISGVLQHLLPFNEIRFPAPRIIPALRQIGSTGASFDDFSGRGLIDRLAQLQNPGPTERHFYDEFDKINRLLREVTGDSTATIEIPHDRSEVQVHAGGKVLPLSSLGTGIHEVVMIGAFCTIAQDTIVCIEEPEIHLHPLLQKKLIKYLNSQTSNQYFIATHSPSLIDYPGSAVFHVTQENNGTKIGSATMPQQRFEVCRDLGYLASDLLQTNAIVWVEGPSDRVYLHWWISAMDPRLEEGTHYSIMFYGGRLLSHLNADDEDLGEFISLLRLNRNIVVVMDSDKRTTHSHINETKKRLKREVIESGGIAWVTAGREIENYINESALSSALSTVYPTFANVEKIGRFEQRLSFKDSKGTTRTNVDKIRVAREVCAGSVDWSVLDLKERVSEVVNRIKQANGL